jgi:hypothetical protein
VLRAYHTAYTGTPDDWVDTTPLARFAPDAAVVSNVPGTGATERYAAHRCSLIYFKYGYLEHKTGGPAPNPPFWTSKDPHQAVPMAMFGHAAACSGLPAR